MRDISSYDVKKVKESMPNPDAENLNPVVPVDKKLDTKARKAAVKNNKVKEFEEKKERILGMLDLN